MRSHGKCQAHVHAAREMLDRGIQEFFNPRKIHDLIEFAGDLNPAHPKNSSVEVNILADCQLGVKTGSHFQKGTNPAVKIHPAGGWAGYTRQDLEQGALAGAIASDDADRFTTFDFEGDIIQRPEGLLFPKPLTFQPAQRHTGSVGKRLTKCCITRLLPANFVLLSQVFHSDGDITHSIGCPQNWIPYV